MFHMVFVQIPEFDWLPGQKRVKFRKIVKIFSETIRWMKLLLFIHAYGIIIYINFCQVTNLVAMKTFFIVVDIPGQ